MYNELLAFTTVPIIQGFYIIVNPIIKVFSGMIYVKCKKQVENAKNLENNDFCFICYNVFSCKYISIW